MWVESLIDSDVRDVDDNVIGALVYVEYTMMCFFLLVLGICDISVVM